MKKNPYREVLALLQASGATHLLADYSWATDLPTPCGCLFGTVTRHAGVATDYFGPYATYAPQAFREWAGEHGLTWEIVEELEIFNDRYAAEALSDELEELGIDPDEAEALSDELEELGIDPDEDGHTDERLDIDFEHFSKDRYAAVVAYLEEKATAFDKSL